MRSPHRLLLLVALLVGCSAPVTGQAAPGEPVSASRPSGAARLHAELVAAGVPYPNHPGYEEIAESVCEALDNGATFREIRAFAAGITSPADAPLTFDEVGAVIQAAVGAYCPEHATLMLDTAALNRDVRTVLVDDYGLVVDSVSCPAGVRVERGASFQCDVTIAGQARRVTLTVTDDAGAYSVGRPR